ncbi:hypothetical protein C8R46DRAFT_1078643 [Mycena filopes]|nr:hypothetical protein C8R46DRAFT_1078643 [Mycena filopes]
MPPASKRRRTDDSDAPPATVTRSTEYWFDDGNIILQVESTQFRVAKSVLARHSSVFRDMFTITLPADEPTIEGCPVVVLSGDTARDWEFLLRVIYPKGFLEEEVPSLAAVAGILRLSIKYDLPIFRKDCVRRLKAEFPASLQQYDDFDAWSLIREEDGIYIPLLALAREVELHSILPVVYAAMITMHPEKYMPRVLDPGDTSLSATDRLACLLGCTNLLKLQYSTTLAWFDLKAKHLPSVACRQPTQCVATVKEKIVHQYDHPDFWIFDDWQSEWNKGLCGSCLKRAKKIYEDGRRTCWEKLPVAFGLAEWKDLKRYDVE